MMKRSIALILVIALGSLPLSGCARWEREEEPITTFRGEV